MYISVSFSGILSTLCWLVFFGNASGLFAHDHVAADHGGATKNVVRSRQDGAWSNATTWEGRKTPVAGDRVLIRPGHHVLYDVASSDVIRGISIAGTLTFARDKDTQLNAGLIRIEAVDEYSEEGFDCLHAPDAPAGAQGGALQPHGQQTGVRERAALEVGLPGDPVPAEHTALIRLHYVDGMDAKSCPAILCCGGRMDLHGAPLERTWVKLPHQAAQVGESKMIVPSPLPGWKVGDRIVITATTRQFGYLGTRLIGDNGEDNSVADNPASEERTITGMKGWGGDTDTPLQIIGLDQPLKFNHRWTRNFQAEVANLSRNVIVESADPGGVRGHTMYQADSAGSIRYAELRHLGKKDVLGRYALHYHLVGDTMRGSSVIGASIWDSHNRWITIHGTQYLVVRDCVGYKSVGHGFFLEDGTEVFNVLDRNLAIQALGGKPLPNQVLPYDENLGSGYWWANSLNTFTRNVAVECDEDGFRFEVVKTDTFDPVLPIRQSDGTTKRVDIRTLPFVRFEDNESHCQRLFAFNLGGLSLEKMDYLDSVDKAEGDVGGVGPDPKHPFIIRNLKAWDTHWAFHAGSPCIVINGADFYDCTYAFWRCVMHRHQYENVTLDNVNIPMFFPRAVGAANYRYAITNEHFDLEPTDDQSPITIITHVAPQSSGTVRVRGVTSDDYAVEKVTINGHRVRPLRKNFAEWEIDLPSSAESATTLTAQSQDARGNLEEKPHVLVVSCFERAKPSRGLNQTADTKKK